MGKLEVMYKPKTPMPYMALLPALPCAMPGQLGGMLLTSPGRRCAKRGAPELIAKAELSLQVCRRIRAKCLQAESWHQFPFHLHWHCACAYFLACSAQQPLFAET